MKINLNALNTIPQFSVSRAAPFSSATAFNLSNITGVKNQSAMPNKKPSFISAHAKNNTKPDGLNQEKTRRQFPSLSSITKPFQNNTQEAVKNKGKIPSQFKKTEYAKSNSFSHMAYLGVFPESNARSSESASVRKASLQQKENIPNQFKKTEYVKSKSFSHMGYLGVSPDSHTRSASASKSSSASKGTSASKNSLTKSWFTNGIKTLFHRGSEGNIGKNNNTTSSRLYSTLPNYKKNMTRLDKSLDENMGKLLNDSAKTSEKKGDFIHINLATSYNANLDKIIKNALNQGVNLASERMQAYLQDVGGYIKSLGVDGNFNSKGIFEANLMSNPLRNNLLQAERTRFSQEFTQVDDMNMFEEILKEKLDSVYTKGINKFLIKYGPPGSTSLKEHLHEKFHEHFPEVKTQ